MEDKVYAFQYNPCIYESGYCTISLHKTCKGAYQAMRTFILREYNIWRENGIRRGKQPFKHGAFEDWRMIVLPIYE